MPPLDTTPMAHSWISYKVLLNSICRLWPTQTGCNLENRQAKKYSKFNFFICSFLVGYGKYVPITMLGRVVGVFCSITGIFFIAMIFVFLVLYITLDDDENQVS